MWKVAILLVGLIAWLHLDLKQGQRTGNKNCAHDFDYLKQPDTGRLIEPRTLIDVTKLRYLNDDYLNATSPMDRLYDMHYHMNLLTWLELDQDYSSAQDLAMSGWPVASRTKCDQDLKAITRQIRDNRNYTLMNGRLGHELTQLLDSFGKPQSGLYSGVITWPGSYEQCLKTSLNGGQIKTRYCWARMKPKWWPKQRPVRPQPRIRVGICLPETCDTSDFKHQRQTIEWLLKLDFNEFYRDNLELDSMFCLPDERSPIRQLSLGGRIYLAVLIGWCATVLASTIFYNDITRQLQIATKQLLLNGSNGSSSSECVAPQREAGQRIRRYKIRQLGESDGQAQQEDQDLVSIGATRLALLKAFKSFSLQSSLEVFNANKFAEQKSLQGSSSRRGVDLSCLHAIKFIMSILIVLGHVYFLAISTSRSTRNKVTMATQGTGNAFISLNRLVDTFFVLFGLLASYNLLRKVKTVEQLASWRIWIGYNTNVVARIAPVYLLVYLYAKLVSPIVSHGPWWDYGVYEFSFRSRCLAEPWWKIIPQLVSLNTYPLPFCLPTAWFLVVYFQVSLVLPLIVYALCKMASLSDRYKWTLHLLFISVICGISAASTANKMQQQTSMNYDNVGDFGALMAEISEKYDSFGMMTSLSRLASIVVGCYVGYLLRTYDVDKTFEWPRWLQSKLVLVFTIISSLVVFIAPVYTKEILASINLKPNLTIFIAVYLAACLLWWVFNSLLIIMATTTFKQSPVIKMLSAPFWYTANKLGLSIYLVHWEVLFLIIMGHEHGPTFGFDLDMLKMFSLGVFLTIALSFLVYIVIEVPFNALVDQLASSRHKKAESIHKEMAANGVAPIRSE